MVQDLLRLHIYSCNRHVYLHYQCLLHKDPLTNLDQILMTLLGYHVSSLPRSVSGIKHLMGPQVGGSKDVICTYSNLAIFLIQVLDNIFECFTCTFPVRAEE